jgi:hypothetical protein
MKGSRSLTGEYESRLASCNDALENNIRLSIYGGPSVREPPLHGIPKTLLMSSST